MNYRFDLTKLSVLDYALLMDNKPATIVMIAGKCSLIDINVIPLTELTSFLDDFMSAFVEYMSIQYPEVKS